MGAAEACPLVGLLSIGGIKSQDPFFPLHLRRPPELLPSLEQQAVVGHLLGQGMLEDILQFWED
jgi:hypothetical protein